jgi:hypothetical protein
VRTFDTGRISEIRSASWPPGSRAPERFQDLHATFRPVGQSSNWSRLRESVGSLFGGGRGAAPPIADEVSSIRLTSAAGMLPRHEIAYRNGDSAIVDTQGRPYQREGGAPPSRSRGAPLSEPPATLHRSNENVNPPRGEDGSFGFTAPPPKQLSEGPPPALSPFQLLREVAGDTAASFHLGHARSASQSEDPFADNFLAPPPAPTYEHARQQPELPLAATQASDEPPPPPTYREAQRTADTTYYPPNAPRPPGPPISPPYSLFDPAPRPRPAPPGNPPAGSDGA